MSHPSSTQLSAALTSLSLLLLFWSVHLKDPHLLSFRSYETPTLLLAAMFLLGVGRHIEQGVVRRSLYGVIVASMVTTLEGEATYRYQVWTVERLEQGIAKHIGRRFIAGYSSFNQIEPLVRRGLVAGVFLTTRNVAGRDAAAIRQEIAVLQQARKEAGLSPLLVATDQEGGLVSRLSPPLERTPSLGTLLAKPLDDAEVVRLAWEYGRRQGEELADLGVNINFSPVVDLGSDGAPAPLDFHTRIDLRALGEDPRRVALASEAYARGLAARGVRATFKHFPGLGGVTADTHHFSAVIERSRGRLNAREWLPFRRAGAVDGALIMLSHVVLPSIDPYQPVSLSREVVQGVLREEWGFTGTLVTDDLTMGAVYRGGVCPATRKALEAGVDLLLVAYDHEKIYPAIYCALKSRMVGAGDARS